MKPFNITLAKHFQPEVILNANVLLKINYIAFHRTFYNKPSAKTLLYNIYYVFLQDFLPYCKRQLNNNRNYVSQGFFMAKRQLNLNNYHIFAGLFGCAFFLILVPFVGCDPVLAISLLCAACGVNAFGAGGFSPNHVDLSSRFVMTCFCYVTL